jgi:hypothetical protein
VWACGLDKIADLPSQSEHHISALRKMR